MSLLDKKAVEALLAWYSLNGIAYPWAGTTDAWAVWISEVMLQQTTVAAVEPRYRRWMERFPDVGTLASAVEEEVLREWEGLGYYSRARNLVSAAREVMSSYGGTIPGSAETLIKLPGVGAYTASAIASFAYGERCAALDANGRRIAQRLAARKAWDSTLEKEFRTDLESHMPADNPGRLNAALMQFGQIVCRPRRPDCGICPLSSSCLARAGGQQEEIPVRRRGELVYKETRLALMLDDEGILMYRRESGLGRGLWFFPALEEPGFPGAEWQLRGELPKQLHSYTRYRETLFPQLFASLAESSDNSVLPEGLTRFALKSLHKRPMASAYRRIVDSLFALLEEIPPNKR